MGSSEISYGVESYKLESMNVDSMSKYVRFLILSSSDKSRTLSTVSPFAFYKGITGIGEPKAVRKLKSGDFLIETSTQTKSFLLAKSLLDIPISVVPHKSLNSIRGVISETELRTASDSDILEGFASQGVIHAHRIHIKKGTESSPTQHIVLTFNKTELPKSVIAGYLHCRIRLYVPNPTRCYKCQRFGHSKVACRGKQVCSRCASEGHSFTDCHAEPKCANCAQLHESNSKQCPTWHQEKQIQKLKVTKNISYIAARKLCQPTTTPSFAAVVKESKLVQTTETFTQTDASITGLL
ncbi:hypothetical protein AVEN_35240-1 [Araneus ventricosus]|uniref:CCHC-type domain-containing protein n=1 Tax=Araneus ventricosus TaxID=182803 RepID=A0A4Y2UX89_ARAVE|nr:hypothetical protein AVEN_35240-1 [Araneus ventricosus]